MVFGGEIVKKPTKTKCRSAQINKVYVYYNRNSHVQKKSKYTQKNSWQKTDCDLQTEFDQFFGFNFLLCEFEELKAAKWKSKKKNKRILALR